MKEHIRIHKKKKIKVQERIGEDLKIMEHQQEKFHKAKIHEQGLGHKIQKDLT